MQKAIQVIRHSLAAASAALDLLDGRVQPEFVPASTVVQEVVEAAVVEPVVETVEPVAEQASTVSVSKLGTLLEMLNDPRWKLRTEAELDDHIGGDSAVDLLKENDIDYVTLTRRSDQALLIGLSSRQ